MITMPIEDNHSSVKISTRNSAHSWTSGDENSVMVDRRSAANKTMIDVTLLRGLEPAMSTQQQALVTALMVSGDPNDLAKAAKILYDVQMEARRNFHGKKGTEKNIPTSLVVRKNKGKIPSPPPEVPPGFYKARAPTVKTTSKKSTVNFQSKLSGLPLPVRMPRVIVLDMFDPYASVGERDVEDDANNSSESEDEAEDDEGWNLLANDSKTEPTKTRQTRSPNKHSVKRRRTPPLTFVDDRWDGTLGDAFTKIQIQYANRIPIAGPLLDNLKDNIRHKVLAKKEGVSRHSMNATRQDSKGRTVHIVHQVIQETPGTDEIVYRQEGGYEARLLMHFAEWRVLISNTNYDHSSKNDCWHRGDVITHINGKELRGKSMEEVKELISEHYRACQQRRRHRETTTTAVLNDDKLELVVNAELCIAQALKLRAMGSSRGWI